MRALVLILATALLLLSVFFILNEEKNSLTGFVVRDVPNLEGVSFSKVDREVVQQFEGKEKLDVIVNLKENAKEPRSLTSDEITQKFASRGLVARVNKRNLIELESDANVESVEPIRYFDIALNDAVEITNANDAWLLDVNGVNLAGEGKTICVVDTGVDFTHSDLQSKNILGCNLNCYNQLCALDCDATDLNGHGTHVAGIAAASGGITGFAYESNIIGLKVFSGSSGTGATTVSIRNAIDWCVDNAEEYNIFVITISIASSSLYASCCDSSFVSFRNSINSAVQKNISVTVATGNNGLWNRLGAPACICNATAVSATNKDDSVANYANYANYLELVAPGTSITSTCIDGSYCEKTGTSMSTPMVAGTLSLIGTLLEQTNRTMTPLELRALLGSTGKPISHPRYPNKNFSRIDVLQAALSLDSVSPVVNLVSPVSDAQVLSQNIVFTCNASDWQLSSASLYLWDADTGELFNSSVVGAPEDISGAEAEISFNITNLSSGNYLWNCLVNDSRNNSAFAASNSSLFVGGIVTNLLFPEDVSYLNDEIVNFGCSARTLETDYVQNVSIFVWNSSNLVYTESQLPVAQNYSYGLFTNVSLEDGNYLWNCESESVEGFRSANNFNYSLVVDKDAPIIFLLSPANNSVLQAGSILFSFDIEELNGGLCSLVANDEVRESFNPLNGSMNVSHDFGDGDYLWFVECTDLAGNYNKSEERYFIIESSGGSVGGGGSGGSGGGGGGGGGGSAPPSATPPQGSSEEVPQFSPPPLGNGDENESVEPESNETQGGTTITGGVIFDFFGSGISWILLVILIFIVVVIIFIILRKRKRANVIQANY